MPLDNCVRCGKLFNRLSRPICTDCAREEERQAKVVMDFLKDSPSATIEEIAGATGVDSRVILRLIRDDRLQITSAHYVSHSCRACGASITAGQYCFHCLRKFGRALTGKDIGRSGTRGAGGTSGPGRAEGAGDLRGGLGDADRARIARMATPERRRGDKKP
jgi:hypothetical protein